MKKSIFQNYYYFWCCCCSVAKLCPTLCNPMHCSTRLPCPSLSPGVFSSSCPLSRWCYLSILSSVALFSFCLQSFPALESFPMSWFFVSGSQSIGASVLASVPSINGASLVAQLVKNPPAMQETWVQSLGWEDALEKGKATHSSILAWRTP